MAWDLGYRLVELDVYNKTMVDILQGKSNSPCLHLSLIQEVRRLILQQWTVKITHVWREANRCADALANVGFSCPVGLYVWDCPPNYVKDILFQDATGEHFPNFVLCNVLGFCLPFELKKKKANHTQVAFFSESHMDNLTKFQNLDKKRAFNSYF